MEKKRLLLKISGRVQGVGYRWFVRDTARAMGASGWVRNEPDGSVSAEVQGLPGQLDSLVRQLKTGNYAACVTGITASQLPEIAQEKGFEIKI